MKTMLGDKIYELRKRDGLTQEELADRLGVSNKAVSKWETNEANPEITLIPQLAEIFNVSTDELFGRETEPRDNTDDIITKKSVNGYVDAVVLGVKGRELKEKYHYEFISNKKNDKGDPSIHINLGLGFYKAQGTLAIGMISKGKISCGLVSTGLLSFGLLAFGLVSFALLGFGLLFSMGAIAIGAGASFGAIAAGFVAFGAIAIGYIAFGALAIGYYAHTSIEGIAIGVNTFIHNANILIHNIISKLR